MIIMHSSENMWHLIDDHPEACKQAGCQFGRRGCPVAQLPSCHLLWLAHSRHGSSPPPRSTAKSIFVTRTTAAAANKTTSENRTMDRSANLRTNHCYLENAFVGHNHGKHRRLNCHECDFRENSTVEVLDNDGKLCNTGTIYANGLLRSFLTLLAILSRLMFPARLLFCGKLDMRLFVVTVRWSRN